jgi:hypothetical protein
MIATTDPITAARAAALFVSDLSVTGQPTGAEVAAAIQHSLRTHGGSRGCAADMAATYGDYPELAVPRMRWARDIVDCLYPRRVPLAGGTRAGIATAPTTADSAPPCRGGIRRQRPTAAIQVSSLSAYAVR